MQAVNPIFIPRNHRVEAVLEAAVNDDDFAPFEELLKVLASRSRSGRSYAATPSRRCRRSGCCRRSAGRRNLCVGWISRRRNPPLSLNQPKVKRWITASLIDPTDPGRVLPNNSLS